MKRSESSTAKLQFIRRRQERAMVKITDHRGRGYDISVMGVIVPSPYRPAVRPVAGRVSSTSSKTAPAGSVKEAEKQKAATVPAGPVKATAPVKATSQAKAAAPGAPAKAVTPAKAPAAAAPAKAATSTPTLVRPTPASAELGEWGADHDDLLLKLRDTFDKSWIDVVVVLGRPKPLLVQRYAELKVAAESGAGKNARAGPVQEASQASSLAAMIAKNMDMEEDGWSVTDPTDCVSDEDQMNVMISVEGDDLNLREMRTVVRLNDYLENQKWLFLASKLFDKTGKRFPAQGLRESLA